MRRFYKSMVLSVAALSAATSFADYQPIAQKWVQYYRGPLKEEVHAVRQTADKGFILIGSSQSYGAGMNDIMLLKTDSLGTAQWSRYFGGANEDAGYAVDQCSDGGYICAGFTRSGGAGEEDALVFKTDALGNAQWSRTLGGTDNDRALSVLQTGDGGFVTAGWTMSSGQGKGDAFLTKLGATGSTLWTKTFGGANWDGVYHCAATSDGGFVLSGETQTADKGLQACVIKTSSTGVQQWIKQFGGDLDETAYCTQQCLDGGYIAVGRTLSVGAGGADGFMMKLNQNGELVWSTTKGGKCDDVIYSVRLADGGGYLLTGNTASFGQGALNAFLVKTDGAGNDLWSSSFPAAANIGSALQQTSDGQFVMALTSPVEGNSDILLAKLAYVEPTPPGTDPVRGVLYQGFTCVDSLSEIGFGGIKKPYWFINKQDGVLQTNTTGGNGAPSRVYSSAFTASRDTGYVRVTMNVGFASEDGLNWRDNNQFWFALCNGQGDQLYTVHFRPNRPGNLGTTYDIRLLRDDELNVIATATTNRVAPCGPGASKVTFSLTAKRSGEIIVGFDAADGQGMKTYINTPDNGYHTFSKLFLKYKTGTAGDGNNHIVVDNLGISEVRE